MLLAQSASDFSWPLTSFAILVFSLLVTGYVLWRRYLSRRMLVERVAELEALSEAGRTLVGAELDVDALCALIATEAGKVIDNSTFQVGLFENDLYHIMFWCINDRLQKTPQTFNLSTDQGVIGWVRSQKKPLLVHDFQRELESLPARPRYISDSPPRSAIFIPLVSGENCIGIVAAQSSEPNRFAQADMRRLMILANQAAAAIANAQLFEQERMRAAHLSLVSKIALQVNAANDLDEIFAQVVWRTQEMFNFHPVTIFTLDEAAGTVIIQACSIAGMPLTREPIEPGQGVVGTAVTSRQTTVVNDISKHPNYRSRLHADETHIPRTRSEISIPLIVNDIMLGVLDVQSASVGAFSTTETMVLEALAAEIASAIYKAQQLAREQEQAWLTTAQLQVVRATNRSNDLEEIATAVCRLTVMLVGVEFCGIMLWDEENERYKGAAFYGRGHDQSPHLQKIHCKLGDWASLDAVHVGQESLTTSQKPRWWLSHFGNADITLQPLLNVDKWIGVMLTAPLPQAVGSVIGRYQFGRRQQELLQNIAQQAAQAIASAHLRLAQQEEAWVNTALLQVAEAVNRLFDLNEILHTIVRLIPMLVGAESAMILIWDEEHETFTAGPSHGVTPMGRGLVETLEIDRSELPTLSQRTVADPLSGSYYLMRPPDWLEAVLATSQAYVLPLYGRGQLVGAMLVGVGETKNGRYLTTRRLNILNGIAQQAATAVVNNQLYREASERDRLQQELNVAREIQSSLIPNGSPNIPGCSVASYWQAARQVSGDFYDFIPLYDGSWGIVIADVADKGFPAALFMALSRTIIRTVATNRTRQDPGDILMRVNEIIDNDAQSDLFVTVFYGIWNPKKNRLTYANGGHNPPLLLPAKGKSHLLPGSGIALGVLPEIKIESHSVRLHPGDTLIFYTDGVTEAMNEDYDEFGLSRMELAANSGQAADAHAIIEAITDSIFDHAGDTPQYDDITMVVMKRES
jgi:serine phosphatase RsbU (regulator of sigma subunit)/putative methionine-R-sulfoxide reductase with GAF domain